MQVPNKARIEVVEPQPKRLLPGMIVYHPNGEILASVREVKAFRANSLRFFAETPSHRALPPFLPPSLPSATAAGFLGLSGVGSGSTSSPMTIWRVLCASTLRSRGMRERFCMG